jgi:cell division septation protein DedD
MVLDYSSRKPVSKNRPRKQPGGFFVLLMVGAVGTAFVLGVGTGWFTSRHFARKSAARAVASAEVKEKRTEAPTPGQGQPAAGRAQEPSLTFYETLPRGGKAVLGSGLNLPKTVEHPPGKAAPSAPPTPAKPAPAAKPTLPTETAGQPKEPGKTPVKATEPASPREAAGQEGEGKGKFIVQVASSKARKEAEAVRDRLTAAGMAAYIVESNIPDKGTWYRVRLGRHLDQQAAHELAGKAGKGAMVIAE